jgi:peptide-methionine (S)-S-oxide reductase
MTDRTPLRMPFRAAVASLVLFIAGAPTALQLHASRSLERSDPADAGLGSTRATADTAVFAGGCFWGIEAVFEHVKGVTSSVSGYAGGSLATPSYEQVSSGGTGHAEAVQVVYDPAKITYAQLLRVFFTVAHDPTQRNRQGPDVGSQYRSAIFYRNEDQKRAADGYIAELTHAKTYARPIVTEVAPLHAFYPAEEYHQNYLARHPTSSYIVVNDAPKLERLRQEFPGWYTKQRTRVPAHGYRLCRRSGARASLIREQLFETEKGPFPAVPTQQRQRERHARRDHDEQRLAGKLGSGHSWKPMH